MRSIIIRKVEEREDARTPNNKEVGYGKSGEMHDKPEVGKPFFLFNGNIPVFKTSTVEEILSETKFKTRNSVYEMIEPGQSKHLPGI